VEKCGTVRQATDDNVMRFACWITKVTNTHSVFYAYCFSRGTLVTPKCLNVKSRVHCLLLSDNNSNLKARILMDSSPSEDES
jgi:hypothetical protein